MGQQVKEVRVYGVMKDIPKVYNAEHMVKQAKETFKEGTPLEYVIKERVDPPTQSQYGYLFGYMAEKFRQALKEVGYRMSAKDALEYILPCAPSSHERITLESGTIIERQRSMKKDDLDKQVMRDIIDELMEFGASELHIVWD